MQIDWPSLLNVSTFSHPSTPIIYGAAIGNKISAGIPDSKKNAKTFANNKITESLIHNANKDTLTELGISVIGARIDIIQHCKYRHHSTLQDPHKHH